LENLWKKLKKIVMSCFYRLYQIILQKHIRRLTQINQSKDSKQTLIKVYIVEFELKHFSDKIQILQIFIV
jgi:hypothetical protein